MQSQYASIPRRPYGLSFSIEELVRVRAWAEQRGLTLTVALDRVIDGAEFEEMLILSPPARTRRTLTIWRTRGSVFAQAPHAKPKAFTDICAVLESLRPKAPRRRGFWGMLGFADL